VLQVERYLLVHVDERPDEAEDHEGQHGPHTPRRQSQGVALGHRRGGGTGARGWPRPRFGRTRSIEAKLGLCHLLISSASGHSTGSRTRANSITRTVACVYSFYFIAQQNPLQIQDAYWLVLLTAPRERRKMCRKTGETGPWKEVCGDCPGVPSARSAGF